MPILESEKELEDYLYSFRDKKSGPDYLEYLCARNLIFRQVQLGNAGIADIICVILSGDPLCQIEIEVIIIELKKGQINLQSLAQVSRYKVAMHNFIDSLDLKKEVQVSCVLIGSDYGDDGAWSVIQNCDLVKTIIYNITFDGLVLEEHEGFKYEGDFSQLNNEIKKSIFPAYKKVISQLRNYKIDFREYSRA